MKAQLDYILMTFSIVILACGILMFTDFAYHIILAVILLSVCGMAASTVIRLAVQINEHNKERIVRDVESTIRSFVDDVLIAVKNIQDTSLNDVDKADRLNALSELLKIHHYQLSKF